MQFSDLGLSEDVLRAVSDAGYTQPTPIQAQAIPVILMGRDVLGLAQTGTGKTAGFTLPMIEILARGRAKARMPRSLILEPTRELATQVAESFKIYGKYHKLSKALLIGGESIGDQQQVLDRGVDVLIATPGRLLDLFERGNILLTDVKILVIDEADRMLDMGFIPDIERIVKLLPRIRQTLFFSATFPQEIRKLADAFLMNPKEIQVAPPSSTAEAIDDHVAVVPSDPKQKRAALRRLLRQEEVRNALIFCNRKRDVDVLARSLLRHGFDVAALHGDMPQPKRTETLDAFRRGDITLLVCSDVAARGLDIIQLSHVFNFDVPSNAEDYVHRVGRTGRAGRRGRAFTLATPEDGRYVSAIKRLIGRDIAPVEVPGFQDLELEREEGRQRKRKGGRRRQGRRPRQAAGDEAGLNHAEAALARRRPAEAATAAQAGESAPRSRPERRPPAGDTRRAARGSGKREQRDKGKREPRRVEEERAAFGESVPAFLRRPLASRAKGG